MAEQEQEQIVYLPPEAILAEGNSRYGLRDVDGLAESIVQEGGVLVAVEVEQLDPKVGKQTHRLTSGFRRHAAVLKLNTEQKAGLLIPAIVRNLEDGRARLLRQLTENMERENQSPMDQAVAIKMLLDVGTSRLDIRKMFARPGRGKGQTPVPASNAWVNITLGLLDLPKTIQEKIHDGRVGFAAAYELGKVTPDKRADVLKRAEAEREGQIEREEKDEQRYLEAEAKAAKVEDEAKAVTAEIEDTKKAVEEAGVLVKERQETIKALKKEPFLELDDDGKKALGEKLKVAEADVKAALKLHKDAQNKVASLHEKRGNLEEKVQDARERLSAARKAQKGSKKKKAVGPEEVKKAAKAEGEGSGFVPLSASDVKGVVKDLQKAESAVIKAVGAALADCFMGKTTTKELIHDLGVAVGEIKPKVAGKMK